MIPIWMVPKGEEVSLEPFHPTVVSTLYSKDHGETWNIGEIIEGLEDGVFAPNERTLIELADGEVLLNVRNGSDEKYRTYAMNPDGISNWTALQYNEWYRDLGCFGGMARYDDKTVLFSNCFSQNERRNNAISISYDEGKTFRKRKILREEIGGYSDICVDADRNVHV